jgi:hypothetical protein
MPKLTTHKFDVQSQTWKEYKENHKHEYEAEKIRDFFKLQRNVTGFYRHIVTMADGSQHVLDTIVLDIEDFMSAARKTDKRIHVLFHEELTGLMHWALGSGLASMDAAINEYYKQHPNLTHGTLQQTA